MARVAIDEEKDVDWRECEAAVQRAHPHPAAAVEAVTSYQFGLHRVLMLVGGGFTVLRGNRIDRF